MAEAAPLVVGIDTLADATVSSDVGEEERSASGPRALSCQLVIESVIPLSQIRGRWARIAAQLGQVKTEPAPACVP